MEPSHLNNFVGISQRSTVEFQCRGIRYRHCAVMGFSDRQIEIPEPLAATAVDTSEAFLKTGPRVIKCPGVL